MQTQIFDLLIFFLRIFLMKIISANGDTRGGQLFF